MVREGSRVALLSLGAGALVSPGVTAPVSVGGAVSGASAGLSER